MSQSHFGHLIPIKKSPATSQILHETVALKWENIPILTIYGEKKCAREDDIDNI